MEALIKLPSDMRRSWHSWQVNGLRVHGHGFQTEKVLRGTPQLLALDSQVDAHAVDKGGWHTKREALLLALNREPGQQQMPDSYDSWDYLLTSSLHRAIRSPLRSSPFFFLISAFLSLSSKSKRDRTLTAVQPLRPQEPDEVHPAPLEGQKVHRVKHEAFFQSGSEICPEKWNGEVVDCRVYTT